MPRCRCGRETEAMDCLTLQRDTEIRDHQTRRFDLCRRCADAIIRALTKPRTALARLQEAAPDGPPYLGLMLDRPTVECLAAGQVNSRAEVAAKRALEEV